MERKASETLHLKIVIPSKCMFELKTTIASCKTRSIINMSLQRKHMIYQTVRCHYDTNYLVPKEGEVQHSRIKLGMVACYI